MMKKEAGARIEEMLCQLADATCIDGEIWRAAYTLEDKIAKNILRENFIFQFIPVGNLDIQFFLIILHL